MKKPHEILERAMELREELFTMANELATQDYGAAACELHESCNAIVRAADLQEAQATQGKMCPQVKLAEMRQISDCLLRMMPGV